MAQATIDQETIARGTEYNGADTLAHSNVAEISAVEEDVILTKESIVIANQSLDQDAFIIYTKHVPITGITNIRHSRLGFNYDFRWINKHLIEKPIEEAMPF